MRILLDSTVLADHLTLRETVLQTLLSEAPRAGHGVAIPAVALEATIKQYRERLERALSDLERPVAALQNLHVDTLFKATFSGVFHAGG
jgi:hypothetical protein